MTMFHDAIKAGFAQALRGLAVGMPGRIESYDSKKGKATIKPLIQEPDTAGALKPLKPITGVPVYMPGGDSASLYLPVKKGDTGWLSFSHRSIEVWLTRGGDSPPGDPRIMDLSDAVFFPGLRPFSAGSFAEQADALVLKNSGGIKMKMRGGKVAIGNSQAELLDIIEQMLTRLETATTITAVGTYPLQPAVLGQITQIKFLLALIKGTL